MIPLKHFIKCQIFTHDIWKLNWKMLSCFFLSPPSHVGSCLDLLLEKESNSIMIISFLRTLARSKDQDIISCIWTQVWSKDQDIYIYIYPCPLSALTPRPKMFISYLYSFYKSKYSRVIVLTFNQECFMVK